MIPTARAADHAEGSPIGYDGAMNNRHYFCKGCGGLRRCPAHFRRRGDPWPREWPRCCGRLMQVLDFEYAAAVVKLSDNQRLKWSSLGQYIFRGRRRGIWKPALSENDVVRAIEDHDSYHKRTTINRPKKVTKGLSARRHT